MAEASATVLSDCKALVPLEQPKRNGRPTKFSQIIWDRILEGAELGEFMTTTLARLREGDPERGYGPDPLIPSARTVREWVQADPELSAALARARDVGDEVILESTIDIADNQFEHPFSRKIRIDTRLKVLAIRNPRMQEQRKLVHANDPVSPLVHNRPQSYTDDELRAIIAAAAAAQKSINGE